HAPILRWLRAAVKRSARFRRGERLSWEEAAIGGAMLDARPVFDFSWIVALLCGGLVVAAALGLCVLVGTLWVRVAALRGRIAELERAVSRRRSESAR